MPFALWMAALNDHASAAALLRRLGSPLANAGDYLRAATPAERDFAAAGFRLEAEAGLPIRQKAPHSELDTYAANWGCALDTEAAPSPAPFLNEGQKSALEKEWKALSAARAAPARLSRPAVAWAAAKKTRYWFN